MNRIKALILKDLFTLKHFIKPLFVAYVIFFVVIFSIRNNFEKLFFFKENLIFIAMLLFLNFGLLFLTTFFTYIYKESSIGKEEIYFAYGYSVFDICFGKSILYSLLSLIPSYFFTFFYFQKLFSHSFFLLNILLLLPTIFFIFSYLTIFFTWFTKLGMGVYFMLFFGVFLFFFKGLGEILKIKFTLTYTNLLIVEVVIILLLGFTAFMITKSIKKGKIIEKLN